MKKYLIGGVVGALLALVAGYLWKGHEADRLAIENTVLTEQLAQAKTEHQKWLEDAMKYIEGQDAQINELQGMTDSLMTVNADLENEINSLHGSSAAALAEAAALRAEVQPALDANPKLKTYVLHLEKVIRDQSDEIELYMKYTENWKQVAANSEKKYLAQVQISDTYKAAIDREAALRKATEQRLSLQDKRIALLSKHKKWALGATAIVIGAAILTATLSD